MDVMEQQQPPDSLSATPGGTPVEAGGDDADTASVLLAWCGWALEIPSTWQPLKIRMAPKKGEVMIGDASCALFSIKWERQETPLATAGKDWVDGRLRSLGVHGDDSPPAAEHFTACAWVRGLQTEEGKHTCYWFAYSEPAQLLVGITVNGVLAESERNQVIEQVLPSLRPTPVSEPSYWCLYDIGFTIPAGFELTRRHLYSGDVALEYRRGRHENLLVRQIYPGELALGRRSYEKWLNTYPYKRYRRLRMKTAVVQEWSSRERSSLQGIRREGWMRIPPPLGACSPRRVQAMAVLDDRLNRLLLVEYASRNVAEARLVEEIMNGMNTHLEAA